MGDSVLNGIEWDEAEPNKEFYRGLVVVIAHRADGLPFAIGTGYIINSDGRSGVAITAAHVLAEVRRLQNLEPRRGRGALDMFLPPPKPIQLGTQKLWVVTREGDAIVPVDVTGVAFDEKTDIGILSLAPMGKNPQAIPLGAFSVTDRVPDIGSKVCVLSFGSLGTRNFDDENPEQGFELSVEPKMRIGRVTAYYPDGHRLCKGPCIETSIPVYSGMSGGVVMEYATDGLMRPLGLVCSDPDVDDERKLDKTRAGASIMALLPVRTVPMPGAGQIASFFFRPTGVSGEMFNANQRQTYAPRGHIYLGEYALVWRFRFGRLSHPIVGKYDTKW